MQASCLAQPVETLGYAPKCATVAAMKLAALALVSFVVAACSSDPEPTKITSTEACAAFTKMTCEKMQECASFKLSTTYGDIETCKARVQIECEAKVTVPNSSATPDRVSACATDGKAVICAEYLRNKLAPTCALAPGGLDTGEACTFDSQCKTTFCRQISGTGCGKCSDRQAVGAACSTTSECDTNAVCSKLKCVVPADVGQGCSPEKPCVGGLKCISGTCNTPLLRDADCKEQGEKCAQGDYCDASTLKCKPITLGQAGEDCGTVQGKVIRCEASGFCGPELDSVCVSAAADEGGCDDLVGPRCLPPAACVAGKCIDPRKTKCR